MKRMKDDEEKKEDFFEVNGTALKVKGLWKEDRNIEREKEKERQGEAKQQKEKRRSMEEGRQIKRCKEALF